MTSEIVAFAWLEAAMTVPVWVIARKAMAPRSQRAMSASSAGRREE